jgi:hypothetical protein
MLRVFSYFKRHLRCDLVTKKYKKSLPHALLSPISPTKTGDKFMTCFLTDIYREIEEI